MAYINQSMSVNAHNAYCNGEKPLSRWTKRDIVSIVLHSSENTVSEKTLMATPIDTLRLIYLMRTSWHHTGAYYNETVFYGIDEEMCGAVTEEMLQERIQAHKASVKAENKQAERKALCVFLVWTGTRKHPKATEVTEECVIRGTWAYRKDGTKKSILANGFREL